VYVCGVAIKISILAITYVSIPLQLHNKMRQQQQLAIEIQV